MLSGGRPRQVVLISFDGSRSIEMWDRTVRLGRELRASFTYFVNSTYLIPDEERHTYKGPQHNRGSSEIGFGGTPETVRKRMRAMMRAWRAGHEIACHGAGHFKGGTWSEAEWRQELTQFYEHLRAANARAQGAGLGVARWEELVSSIRGFRAPHLSTGPGLFGALLGAGFRYDASQVASHRTWPQRRGNGMWQFPTHYITIKGRPTVVMDFNLYQVNGGSKTPPRTYHRIELRTYSHLMRYFTTNMNTARAPVTVVNHFTLYHQGAYFRALTRFARTVCIKPQVLCISYKRYQALLSELPETTRKRIEAGL